MTVECIPSNENNNNKSIENIRTCGPRTSCYTFDSVELSRTTERNQLCIYRLNNRIRAALLVFIWLSFNKIWKVRRILSSCRVEYVYVCMSIVDWDWRVRSNAWNFTQWKSVRWVADLLCRWRQMTQNDNPSPSPPPPNPKRLSTCQERRVSDVCVCALWVVAVARSFDFQYSRTDGQHAICSFKLHATVVSGWIAPITVQFTGHSHPHNSIYSRLSKVR